MHRLALVLAVACPVVALSSAVAHAQTESGDAYTTTVDEALREFGEHRFSEARALFVRAHALSPSARTLRGIGVTSFELRDYVETIRALSSALVEPTRPLTDEQSAEARVLVERSRRFVGTFQLAVRPADARVTVDGGDPVRDVDGNLLLALGTHEIRASAADHEDGRVSVVVLGGESSELALSLAPHAAPESAAITTAPPAAAAHALPSPRASTPSVPGIAMTSLGAIAALASVLTGVAWWLERDGAVAACNASALCDNAATLTSERDGAAGTTVAFAILGAALVISGAILLSSGGDETSTGTAVRCGSTGLGVVCVGAF